MSQCPGFWEGSRRAGSTIRLEAVNKKRQSVRNGKEFDSPEPPCRVVLQVAHAAASGPASKVHRYVARVMSQK